MQQKAIPANDAFMKMIEQYATTLLDLMAVGGIYIAPFLLLYLWYGLKRDFEWKIFDFLYVVVCVYVFAAFVAGGALLGRNFGYGEWGGLAGVFAFWGMFSIMLRLKARKDFRNRI